MTSYEKKLELIHLIKEFERALHCTKKTENLREEAKNRMEKTLKSNRVCLRRLFGDYSYDSECRHQTLLKSSFQAKTEFNEAENDHTKAVAIFEKASQDLAIGIGMPKHYIDNFFIDHNKTGFYHIYFGGQRNPVGKKHGHYVIKRTGEVIYRREYNSRHGSMNRCSPDNTVITLEAL